MSVDARGPRPLYRSEGRAQTPAMDTHPPLASFIVRVVRGRRGLLQLEIIDLRSGEPLALRNLDDLSRLLRRLAPRLR